VTFFDYPGTEVEAPIAPAAEVFLPEASEADWTHLLRYCRRKKFAPGETVIAPGDTERSLYLIVEGNLEVLASTTGHRGAPSIKIGPGSVLGEISFFDNAGRSALVRAITEVEVAELGLIEFDALAKVNPDLSHQILFDLGRILAHRLRTAQGPQ
jgi:CRP/FNR family cyclic AMP-dependent transcriptional regulator